MRICCVCGQPTQSPHRLNNEAICPRCLGYYEKAREARGWLAGLIKRDNAPQWLKERAKKALKSADLKEVG